MTSGVPGATFRRIARFWCHPRTYALAVQTRSVRHAAELLRLSRCWAESEGEIGASSRVRDVRENRRRAVSCLTVPLDCDALETGVDQLQSVHQFIVTGGRLLGNVPPRRPPGCPRLDPQTESINVHFRMSVKEFDETFQRAQQARESLADFIRRRLREPEAYSRLLHC